MTVHFFETLFGAFAGGTVLGGVSMAFIHWTRA